MRTTVNIPDALLKEARERSLSEGRTLGELVAEGLRMLLSRGPADAPTPVEPLPTYGGRGLQDGVDLDNNAALLDLMETR
ncbi:hypothetical protein [Haloferula sp. A504]|uniref:hypothetical protein n=1 Tax=Haloferula sp. A504 TaxID=3373601 RepID=UPI0031BF5037|nr:type II toxin-antitoxin system VapB family antitoxin [Verrucomicrobiaceae bacterium E54]